MVILTQIIDINAIMLIFMHKIKECTKFLDVPENYRKVYILEFRSFRIF